MTDIFFYSIKVAFCLSTVYLFYKLALSRLTFYDANRWFLLIGSLASLCIPLASLLSFPQIKELNNVPSVNAFLAWNKVSYTEANQLIPFWQSYSNLITIIFLVGTVIFGSKLFIQLLAFYHIRKSATLREDGAVKIYQVDKPIAPFSFGTNIFLNQQLLEPQEIRQVIRHEQVHARQKHTLDVMWIECLLLLNWYNPFVWLLRQAVRENLEFIVDKEVIRQEQVDRKSYQYLLLKIIGLSQISIANPFNISSLKNRIHMMNQKPSNSRATGLYLLALPLLILLTFTFCSRTQDEAKPPVELAEGSSEIPLSQEFAQKNAQVNKLYVQPDGIFVVELKSGKSEKYKLSDKKQASLFEERYGQLPSPPPPVIIKPLGNNIVEVDYNTGKKEKYDLNNKAEADVFNKKFGPPPAPVPSVSTEGK